MPSVWSWVRADQLRLLRQNKTDLFASIHAFFKAFEHDDFLRADRTIQRAGALAEEMEEPWWWAFCRHWQLQTWLYGLGLISRSLDLAIATVSEIEKDSIFADLPQRFCLYDDLLRCYLDTDPVGYRDEIVSTAEHLLQAGAADYECQRCIMGDLVAVHTRAGELDQALDWCQVKQARTRTQLGEIAEDLAHIAFQGEKFEEAAIHFGQASMEYEEDKRPIYAAGAHISQALSLIRLGQIDQAACLLDHAQEQVQHANNPKRIWMAFEVRGELLASQGKYREAAEAFGQALAVMDSLGWLRREAEIALKRVEALAHTLGEKAQRRAIEDARVRVVRLKSEDLRSRLDTLAREDRFDDDEVS